MALMIPDTIPEKASQGEKQLFKSLSTRLPDSFIVWYKPSVNNLYPNLIIPGPGFGLLSLEVKGWYALRIERADNSFFHIRPPQGTITKVGAYQHPLKQSYSYFGSVADRLKGSPVLCNPDGNYQGQLCLPIGVGAVMNNMTEAQAQGGHLYSVIAAKSICCRYPLNTRYK